MRAGSTIPELSWKKMVGKWKMGPAGLRLQGWWVYVGAWWGQKGEKWKKYWFLKQNWRVQGHTSATFPAGEEEGYVPRGGFRRGFGIFRRRKSESFQLKCFVSIFRIVLPMQAGSTIPELSWKKWSESEKWGRNVKNGAKIMSDTSKYHQYGWKHEDVIKIMSDTPLKSPKEATCSNNTYHIGDFAWGPAWEAWSG